MDCIASLPLPQTAPQPGATAPAGAPQAAFAMVLAQLGSAVAEPQPAPPGTIPADEAPGDGAATIADPTAALTAAILPLQQPTPRLAEAAPAASATPAATPGMEALAPQAGIAAPPPPAEAAQAVAGAAVPPQPGPQPTAVGRPASAEAATGASAPRRAMPPPAPPPAMPGQETATAIMAEFAPPPSAEATRPATPSAARNRDTTAVAHPQGHAPATDGPAPQPTAPAPAAPGTAMATNPAAEAPARPDTPPRPATEAPAPPGEAAATSAIIAPPAREARAPEAPPPPAPPVPATPARQIAPVVVAVAIAGGTARLSVSLEPAELGRVEISVERHGDVADVRVVAERPETLALLQRDQRELDRTLSQAGIGSDGRSLSFSLSDGGAGAFASGREGDGRGRVARGMPDAAPGATDTAAAAPPRRLLSLIDLAV